MAAEKDPGAKPPRRYKWRYGPMRLVMPWIALAAGIIFVVKGVIDIQDRGDPLFVYVGAGLAVLGVIAFFVYRWMARRGI